MSDLNDIDVLFVAGFSPITLDTDLSTVFYKDTLRLPLKNMEGNNDDLLTGVNVYGVKHFALWPLSPAAQSCFGTEKWLGDVPIARG